MANISGSYDQNAEASTGFDPIPAGDYRAKIVSADIEEVSKNNNYGRCLKLTWQIETGPFDNRLVWQRLNLWADNMNNNDKVISIANSQFAAIREATGKLTPQDTDELLHIPCTIKVAIKADPNYGPSNEVKSVKSVGAQASAPQRTVPQTSSNVPAVSQQKGSAPWRKAG